MYHFSLNIIQYNPSTIHLTLLFTFKSRVITMTSLNTVWWIQSQQLVLSHHFWYECEDRYCTTWMRERLWGNLIWAILIINYIISCIDWYKGNGSRLRKHKNGIWCFSRKKNKDYKDENKRRIMNPLSRLFLAFSIYTFGSLLS